MHNTIILCFLLALNQIAGMDDPTGQSLRFDHDAQGNITRLAILDHGTTVTVINATYDLLNRLDTVTAPEGIWTYHYNAVGNRDYLLGPNNTRTDYFYDNLNRLTRIHTVKITLPGPTLTDILDLSYELDNAGNRTKITERMGGSVVTETSYEYDDLYRLKKETRTGLNAYVREYAYNAVGNRLSQTTTGVLNETRTYTYDDNDRLLTETVLGGGTTVYGYDANGNVTSKNDPVAGITAYTWDAENHLISASGGGQPSMSYVYDGDGNRVSKTVGGVTTRYLVDTHNNSGFAQVVREADGSGAELAHYVYGDDLLAQSRLGATSHFHYDGLGSTRALTDPDGTTTESYNYYGFGEDLGLTGAPATNYRFAGEQYDPDLKQYYLRARYYDPRQGRFGSMDTVPGIGKSPTTLNKYHYVSNRPPNFTDPSGQWSFSELSVTQVGVAALAGISVASAAYLGAALPAAFDPFLRGVPKAKRIGRRMNEYAIDLIRSDNKDRYLEAFERWFGEWSETNETTVLSTLEDTLEGFDRDYNFWDARKILWNSYANSPPLMPGWIWLGRLYEEAPLQYSRGVGSGTKAGTIFHEISHIAAETRDADRDYGWDAAELVVNAPKLTLKNADSYTFFVEDLWKMRRDNAIDDNEP